MKSLCQLVIYMTCLIGGFSQTPPVEWRAFPIERLPPDKRPSFHKLFCSSSGSVILSSTHGLIKYRGMRIDFPSVSIMAGKKERIPAEKIRDPHTKNDIRIICKGYGSNFFFLTSAGRVYYIDENLLAITGWANPPLYIPLGPETEKNISCIWADEDGDLFIGVKGDSLIIIPGIGKNSPSDGKMDAEGNFISNETMAGVKKVFLPGLPDLYSFTKDIANPGQILLATSKGLLRFTKKNEAIEQMGETWGEELITTGIMGDDKGNVWFSTIGHGIGFYDAVQKSYSFYNDGEARESGLTINSFCRKTKNEFFVAVADSVPAIFNSTTHSFAFLNDTTFDRSENRTTDIRMDGFGNLFVVKGGALFYTNAYRNDNKFTGIQLDSSVYAPFIYEFQVNDRPYFEVVKSKTLLPYLKEITLKYNQGQLAFSNSLLEFWDQSKTEMAWKLDGLNMDWVIIPKEDRFTTKLIPTLKPGKYVFRIRARTGDGDWRKQEAALTIIVNPPIWKTWWFWLIAGILIIGTILFFYTRHISSVRKKERQKVIHEKEMMELEAKALRAQMNPHFVFNSLNSIKSLINKNDNEKAAGYLATFSKLIRTLFQNSDKREVSLHEELETCKLYTQLEKMRFGDKIDFVFDIDERIDLKDFKVPALILQPFIENAIWHGLMPKEEGGSVTIGVKKNIGSIQCIIDDNGIGRKESNNLKPQYEADHQSKGIGLTHSRLELDKILNEREDAVEIIDKIDQNGRATGTTVTLTFKEESQ